MFRLYGWALIAYLSYLAIPLVNETTKPVQVMLIFAVVLGIPFRYFIWPRKESDLTAVGFMTILAISFTLGPYASHTGECHTDWDGKNNPTVCDR